MSGDRRPECFGVGFLFVTNQWARCELCPWVDKCRKIRKKKQPDIHDNIIKRSYR